MCVIAGSALIAWLFAHLGRFDLARPTLISIGMLGVAVAIKWKLRRHIWFWIIMTLIAALHLALILSVSWATEWVPAVAIVPIGIADLYASLGIVSVVGTLIGKARDEHPRVGVI